MTVNDASLNESGSKLSKVAATSLLLGVTRGSSEAYSVLEMFDSSPAASVVVLFVPDDEDFEETVQLVSKESFSIPVYVDFERCFLDNKIPEDVRFHSFLLDEDGHPVVVGNPISSDRLRDLMLNQL